MLQNCRKSCNSCDMESSASAETAAFSAMEANTETEPYEDLGCWGDKWTPRAISGEAIKVSPASDGVKQCADYAESQGFTVFALQYHIWCFTSADAGQTYKKYGEVANCADKRGGTFASSVYRIK